MPTHPITSTLRTPTNEKMNECVKRIFKKSEWASERAKERESKTMSTIDHDASILSILTTKIWIWNHFICKDRFAFICPSLGHISMRRKVNYLGTLGLKLRNSIDIDTVHCGIRSSLHIVWMSLPISYLLKCLNAYTYVFHIDQTMVKNCEIVLQWAGSTITALWLGSEFENRQMLDLKIKENKSLFRPQQFCDQQLLQYIVIN